MIKQLFKKGTTGFPAGVYQGVLDRQDFSSGSSPVSPGSCKSITVLFSERGYFLSHLDVSGKKKKDGGSGVKLDWVALD